MSERENASNLIVAIQMQCLITQHRFDPSIVSNEIFSLHLVIKSRRFASEGEMVLSDII